MSEPIPATSDDEDPPEQAQDTELLVLARPEELVPREIREASFSSALRGYDRDEVDAFVERVGEMIAELEISRSPQKAVKRALDRVGEQTARILQEAREAAEDLTASARAESEHATRRARIEADELMERTRAESQELLDRAERESEELLARSRARLAELEQQLEQTRDARRRALQTLRATAAELEVFAARTETEAKEADEIAAIGAGAEPSEEQQVTQVIAAVEAGAGEDVDPGGERRPAQGGSSRFERQRHPRPARDQDRTPA